MSLLNLAASTIDISGFCDEMGAIVQLIGYILLVFKVAIPVLIIAFGVFDFGKAVVAEKEDEIKKQTKRLIFRVIAGIVIFLIPNIILFIFGLIAEYNADAGNASFDTCQACILNPAGSDCKDSIK